MLATTEEIQRRLVRPSSSSSHRSSATPFSTIKSQNHGGSIKTRKVNMNKLEDYLDPVLLSAIRSKMKNRYRGEDRKVKSRVSTCFEWPSNELSSFIDDTDCGDDSRVVKRKKSSNAGVVSLMDDIDGEIVPIEEEHDEEVESSGCSPFGRFEITVSKFFGN